MIGITSTGKHKVLLFGDAACAPTGFGKVTKNILLGLHDLNKYDLYQFGLNYLGDPHTLPFPIFPSRPDDLFGKYKLYQVLNYVDPDVFITVNDINALMWIKPIIEDIRRLKQKPIPWIAYFPVDGKPLKYDWITYLKRNIDIPVTYTKWAQDAIKEIDSNFNVDYVYHGVDRLIYYEDFELSKNIKKALSESMGREINFVVGYVGRNQERKRLPELISAFSLFSKDKEDVLLYLHTAMVDQAGWNLKEVVKTCGCKEGTVIITPNFSTSIGLSEEDVANIYRSFDILCLPTVGEGFGLPLIEGMACGCAILSTDCSVIPELMGINSGIPTMGFAVNPGSYMIFTKDNEFLRPVPSVSEMVGFMNHFYENRPKLEVYKKRAIERSKYFATWNIDKWDGYIQQALDKSKVMQKGLDFDLELFEEI